MQLVNLHHKDFVRSWAGYRPPTPRRHQWNLILTLEDGAGNINVIVWKGIQEIYRKVLLTAKLLLIKSMVEIATEHVATSVVHVIAGQLYGYTIG